MSTAGIDHLTCTVQSGNFSELVQFCEMFFGERETINGVHGYRHCEKFGDRAYLRHSIGLDGSAARPDTSLEITGKTLGYYSMTEILDLIHALVFTYEGRWSRIDLCVDDEDWLIHPRQLNEMIFKGWITQEDGRTKLPPEVVPAGGCGVKGLRPGNCPLSADGYGATQYFGARGKSGSLAFLRVYDKFSESGGRVNACRWEVQFGKEKAVFAADELLNCNGDLSQVVAKIKSLVFGVVDFVDERGKRLEWFQTLVGL